MNADEIVRMLRAMLPPQVDYAELVASPVPSSYGIRYVWEDPEPYTINDAADLIESLQAQLTASQRRADAAVEDLREHAAFAATCNRYGCGYDCQSPRCPGWQWRGPQDEKGANHD